MMKRLVRGGKAFPNRFFVAIGLLLCLFADGAAAAPTHKSASPADCASNKNRPPCVAESPTGQVTVFWPKLHMGNAIGRAVESKIEVWIDKANAGMVKGNAPLTVSLPNGPHKLALKPYDDWLENVRPVKETEITVSAQKPLYFQIIHQGFAITAGELDAATAQAVLSGKEPTAERNAPTSQAALPSQEPKDKPNALPPPAALAGNPTAALAGNDANLPSGSGTIYLYWPSPALGFGFLDKFSTDVPVFLDGKRIGAMTNGDYLVVKLPSGEHSLGLDVGLSSGRLLKQDIVLGMGSTRYFHVERQDAFRIFEDSPEEAADHAKKASRQREVSVQ